MYIIITPYNSVTFITRYLIHILNFLSSISDEIRYLKEKSDFIVIPYLI